MLYTFTVTILADGKASVQSIEELSNIIKHEIEYIDTPILFPNIIDINVSAVINDNIQG